MKKWVLRILFGLLVLLVLAILAVGLLLDGIVKRGVETGGPLLTGVDVALQSVRLSLFAGSGKVQGLVLGNPKGFKSASAISVGSASLALSPGSLLSDKIVIKSIIVQGPEITFETDLKNVNLKQILNNMKSHSGGSPSATAKPEAAKGQKKLEVDEFVITGGKVHVSVTALGSQSVTVPLPPIYLHDLGKGPDGITASDLATRVLEEVYKSAETVASSAVADLEKGGLGLKESATSAATNALQSIKGIGDLLKKK